MQLVLITFTLSLYSKINRCKPPSLLSSTSFYDIIEITLLKWLSGCELLQHKQLCLLQVQLIERFMKTGGTAQREKREKVVLSTCDITHLWERKPKKEKAPRVVQIGHFLLCPEASDCVTDIFPCHNWFFSLSVSLQTEKWSVSPAVMRWHFAFSSKQDQGFIFFLSFPFTKGQKKLKASKRRVAEGQIETHKRCLEYSMKLNFQFFHHCCLVNIIFTTRKKSNKAERTLFTQRVSLS